MDEYLIQGETLTEIADAIRSKTGSSNKYHCFDFASAIRNIQTSSGETTTGSNVVTGDIFLESSSSTIAFNCSFLPSKIILWGGFDGTEDAVIAFLYDSTRTYENFSFFTYNSERLVQNWQGEIDVPSSDDPYYWVKQSSGSIVIGLSDTVGHTFTKGEWYYIAIA